jgi:hypothetical protein
MKCRRKSNAKPTAANGKSVVFMKYWIPEVRTATIVTISASSAIREEILALRSCSGVSGVFCGDIIGRIILMFLWEAYLLQACSNPACPSDLFSVALAKEEGAQEGPACARKIW